MSVHGHDGWKVSDSKVPHGLRQAEGQEIHAFHVFNAACVELRHALPRLDTAGLQ